MQIVQANTNLNLTSMQCLVCTLQPGKIKYRKWLTVLCWSSFNDSSNQELGFSIIEISSKAFTSISCRRGDVPSAKTLRCSGSLSSCPGSFSSLNTSFFSFPLASCFSTSPSDALWSSISSSCLATPARLLIFCLHRGHIARYLT